MGFLLKASIKDRFLNNFHISVNCIWSYMNCSGGYDEYVECMERFSDCSDSLQEQDDWKGLPLPDVPGLNLQSFGDTATGESWRIFSVIL